MASFYSVPTTTWLSAEDRWGAPEQARGAPRAVMASFYSVPTTMWLSAEDIERHACTDGTLEPLRQDAGVANGAAEATPRSADDAGRHACTEGTPEPLKYDCGAANGPVAALPAPDDPVPRTLYGRSVRRAALDGVDAREQLNSATSAYWRIRRGLLGAGRIEDVLGLLEHSLSEFDPFQCSLAVHRLARIGRLAHARRVLDHPQWPRLVAKLTDTLPTAEPRHVASAAWAFANLLYRDGGLIDMIADRCVHRGPGGDWDPMSLSLVAQSFAMLGARHPPLLVAVSARAQKETSATWDPGDVSRVVWACARLLHRDDGLFRDASCKALSRLHESSPTVLTQTLWAFATAAPAGAASHLFPRAAEEALRGPGALDGFSPAHLAMIAWSFAAVPFRPVQLLEELGDAVPPRGDRLNPQDITMIAWSYATLLAPQRRVFDFLACAARRTVRSFNAQDLSNTAWAFATAGKYAADLFDAIAAEACSRSREFNCQHVAMLMWAFITIQHRHDPLFGVLGACARADRSSWHSAKLLCYALAGAAKLRTDFGSRALTLRVAADILGALMVRLQAGASEADDFHTVHDAVFPWLDPAQGGQDLPDPGSWHQVDTLVAEQRRRLRALLSTAAVDAVVGAAWLTYDVRAVREYQCVVQALGIRGLGSLHTWRFLAEDLGVRRAGAELAQLAVSAKLEQRQRLGDGEEEEPAGRGERANWCFWRAQIRAAGPSGGAVQQVAEPGRVQNSTVVGYREESAGLVAVMLSHDHVSHRAWDCEFRAMARTAAVARLLACGQHSKGEEVMRAGVGGVPSADIEGFLVPGQRGDEGLIEGRLEIHMTEVPCLSCICAMAQFCRRFPRISLEVAWEGMPPPDDAP